MKRQETEAALLGFLNPDFDASSLSALCDLCGKEAVPDEAGNPHANELGDRERAGREGEATGRNACPHSPA